MKLQLKQRNWVRLALLFHEQRAMERKMEKDGVMPEAVPVAKDGHFISPHDAAILSAARIIAGR